jgi:hypothetical protein
MPYNPAPFTPQAILWRRFETAPMTLSREIILLCNAIRHAYEELDGLKSKPTTCPKCSRSCSADLTPAVDLTPDLPGIEVPNDTVVSGTQEVRVDSNVGTESGTPGNQEPSSSKPKTLEKKR